MDKDSKSLQLLYESVSKPKSLEILPTLASTEREEQCVSLILAIYARSTYNVFETDTKVLEWLKRSGSIKNVGDALAHASSLLKFTTVNLPGGKVATSTDQLLHKYFDAYGEDWYAVYADISIALEQLYTKLANALIDDSETAGDVFGDML